MGNTFTNINEDIISTNALEEFNHLMLPISIFSTNYSSEAAKPGDKVSVPIVANTSAGALTKVAGSAYTIQDATVTSNEISLGQPTYVSMWLDDAERAQSGYLSMRGLEDIGRQKGAELAETIFPGILAVVTAANYGAPVWAQQPAGFDDDAVVAIRKKCNILKMPRLMRVLVLDEDYTEELLKDDVVKRVDASGDSRALREGAVGHLRGFDVFESIIIPENSENLKGFAAHPAGMGVAMRYNAPQDGNKYFRAQSFEYPGSGITLGLRDWYDENEARRKTVLECIYGTCKGIGNGIGRITT